MLGSSKDAYEEVDVLSKSENIDKQIVILFLIILMATYFRQFKKVQQ